MSLEVILTSNVKNLGNEGDQIKVADGYARNFLLPQNLAIVANEASKKRIESLHHKKAEREREELAAAQEHVKKLEKLSLTLQAPVGEHEKLFGSVTAQDISKALAEKGFEVDRKQIEIETPIRKAGQYEVTVKLHTDISAKVKINVEAGDVDSRGEAANTGGAEAKNARGKDSRGAAAKDSRGGAAKPSGKGKASKGKDS